MNPTLPSFRTWSSLLLLSALVAWAGPRPQAAPARPVVEQPPEDMVWWVGQVLAKNGLPEPKSGVLVKSGKAWVADFRNMAIGTLTEENNSFQVGFRFPDSIRLDGAGVCSEQPASVVKWLDRVARGWKSRQLCSPAWELSRLNVWLKRDSRAPKLRGLGRNAKGEIVSLRLACRDTLVEPALGRLSLLGKLSLLELDGCALAQKTEDGGSYSLVQKNLQDLNVKSLVLRNVRAPYLNFGLMPGLDTLTLDSGDVAWFDLPKRCPDGKTECPESEKSSSTTVSLNHVPVCAPRMLESLSGLLLDDSRTNCEMDAKEGPKLPDDIVTGFGKETDHLKKSNFSQGSRRLDPDLLPKQPDLAGFRQVGVVPGSGSCTRSDFYASQPYFVGGNVIYTPDVGTIWAQDFGTVDSGALRWGTSRDKILQTYRSPLVQTAHFLAWEGEEGLSLILEFDDSNLLDAVWLPRGCWNSAFMYR